MSDTWLNEIKEKVQNVRCDVPEEMFDSIWENAIGERTRRRRIGVIIASAAASAAVVASVLTVNLKEVTTIDAQEESYLTADAGDLRPADAGSVSETALAYGVGYETQASRGKRAVNRQAVQPIAVTAPATTADKEDFDDKPVSTDIDTPGKGNYVNRDETSPRVGFDRQPDIDYLAQILEPERGSQRSNRVGLSISGTTPATNKEMPGLVSFQQIVSSIQNNGDGNLVTTYFGIDNQEGHEAQYRHRMPVGVRVMLSADCADRLSFEGGLSYSFHHSALIDNGPYQYYQQLHFVGIPVGIRYNFLKYGRSSVYVRVGGAVEKCVSGQFYEDAGHNLSKINIDPLFWSAEASLGAQVGIAGPLYVFAEGGISYHFANSSGDLTYYGAHPQMFSLQAGARINLF